MDEGWGALIIGALIIGAIIWVIGLILTGLAYTFVTLSALLGHPIMVVAVLGALGAAGGMVQLRRRKGPVVARSSDDYAEIGSLRLTPEHWAILVLSALIVILVLYGIVVV